MGINQNIRELKRPAVWKKAFNQSGRGLETAGYGVSVAGVATAQPEVVALGGGMIMTGQAYQGIAQGIKLSQGKKISPEKEKMLKQNILKLAKAGL